MLKLIDITLSFGDRNILNKFNLDCFRGTITGIIAPSGTGKTSLFNIIMGFNPNYIGKVQFDGFELNSKTLHRIRNKIAYLPQNINIIGSGTVLETILKPFKFKENKYIIPTEKKIEEILNAFNLDGNILKNDFITASGGEKQRIAFVIAMLLNRELIILDEPTAALDIDSKKIITDYLTKIQNKVIIIATHDDMLLNICTTLVRLSNESN